MESELFWHLEFFRFGGRNTLQKHYPPPFWGSGQPLLVKHLSISAMYHMKSHVKSQVGAWQVLLPNEFTTSLKKYLYFQISELKIRVVTLYLVTFPERDRSMLAFLCPWNCELCWNQITSFFFMWNITEQISNWYVYIKKKAKKKLKWFFYPKGISFSKDRKKP